MVDKNNRFFYFFLCELITLTRCCQQPFSMAEKCLMIYNFTVSNNVMSLSFLYSDDPQIELSYDLDDPEEGGIAVNILPLLLNNLRGDKPGPSSR